MGRLTARKISGTGGHLLPGQLRGAKVTNLVSNPGSAETSIYDAMVDAPELKMIMGLHEGIVAAMADGYSKVSAQPGVVNVHTIAGTAQLTGQLYNLYRDGSPVIVTAGMIDNDYFTDLLGLS